MSHEFNSHSHAPSTASCTQSASSLTHREKQVLTLIADGKTTKEIAHLLRMSFRTAVSHRYHIQQKLHPHNTAALTRAAIRMGLVVP